MMKRVKDFLYLCLILMVTVGSIFAPDILFKVADAQTLEHISEIKVDESNVLITKKATLNDKLELFGKGYDVIGTSISDEEWKIVLENAQMEMNAFFYTYEYKEIISDDANVSITKNIYMRREENIYSFAAYTVRIEKSDYIMEFIMDAEESMILHMEISDVDKSKETADSDAGEIYYGLYDYLAYVTDEKLNKEEYLSKPLSYYYNNYNYDVGLVSGTGTYSSSEDNINIYGDTAVATTENNNRILEYVFYNTQGEKVKYNVEVTDSKIIFNN